jgi:hypothetical protein
MRQFSIYQTCKNPSCVSKEQTWSVSGLSSSAGREHDTPQRARERSVLVEAPGPRFMPVSIASASHAFGCRTRLDQHGRSRAIAFRHQSETRLLNNSAFFSSQRLHMLVLHGAVGMLPLQLSTSLLPSSLAHHHGQPATRLCSQTRSTRSTPT